MTRQKNNFRKKTNNLKQTPPPPKVSNNPSKNEVQSKPDTFFGNMMGTMAQGIAFGTGSSLANKAIDSIFGTNITLDNKESSNIKDTSNELINCKELTDNYNICLEENNHNCGQIKHLLDNCLEMKFKQM